jgi:hypothetical protein
MLNLQLACWIVDSVIGRLAQSNVAAEIECRYGDMVVRQWAHQASSDAALATAIRTLDAFTYVERYRFFCEEFLDAGHSPAALPDGGLQFAHSATRFYVTAEPVIFAANLEEAWQRLRERLVHGLRRGGYPYAPVTDIPMLSGG